MKQFSSLTNDFPDHLAGFVPDTCTNVESVLAGDVLLIPDALLRVEPLGYGTMRICFNYSYQYVGTAPTELPAEVASRLSDETKTLMMYAHVLRTMPLAAAWAESFLNVPRL